MTCSFSAAIRRVPGGAFAKTPKSQAMTAVPMQTSFGNLNTYFGSWPKRRSQFLIYGCLNPRRTNAIVSGSQGCGHVDIDVKDDADSATDIGSLYGGTPQSFPATGDGSSGGGPGPAEAALAAAHAAAAAAKCLGLGGVARRFKKGQKLAMVTAYDFPSSRLAREAGVELILVGDSLGNCRLGLPDTVGVTMEDMLRATSSVRRGVEARPGASVASPKPVVVGDMPFGSYLLLPDALRNAAAFRLAGAEMVKMEGGRHLAPFIEALTRAGIAVMGHIGLEPQKALLQGGLRLQGTTARSAAEIIRDAEELVKAGAVAIVIECVPVEVASAVQAAIPGVPVIGIGAGGEVAGQVLVCDDLLGVHGRPPSFVKMFADVGRVSANAYARYVAEVRTGEFPGEAHGRPMKPEELEKLKELLPLVVKSRASQVAKAKPDAAASPQGPQASSSLAHRQQGFVTNPIVGLGSTGGLGSLEVLPGGRFQALNFLGPRASPTFAAARHISQAASPGSPRLAVLPTRADLSAWRREASARGRRVALVPTMGNLHEGHLELVDQAKELADEVLVSIFVNPAQFAAHEDLDRYPRTLEEDLKKLRERGASAVFAPTPGDMYPHGSPGGTVVVPHFVQGRSEASCRPEHFTGVATVCLKLFNLCDPHVAIFGQKDAMQCVVIARMLEDLMLDERMSLVIAGTSREADGLARSSRNRYPTEGMRQKAPAIYRALLDSVQAAGATPLSVRSTVHQMLEREGMEVSYISVADARGMAEKPDSAELQNSIVSIACILKDNGVVSRLLDCIVVPGTGE
ncbi:unnamed protein product [Polarella glacialis]|uniref:3-methyl-2-oxobutanoate hydroxymethyltransferase n=2 Tax=Polarella glacialis TaxID=89957 RepID=A0A813G904_POLGL|nr:unnamed protein product [Polarella glacialis]